MTANTGFTQTGREIKLAPTAFLVSETDAKGIITFANEDFCHYAGYTVEELIGKPHSIVRHPDMPKEAFKNLWNTIQRGNTWKGEVKNRAKCGSSYTVYATVYPIRKEGELRYLSCRKIANT